MICFDILKYFIELVLTQTGLCLGTRLYVWASGPCACEATRAFKFSYFLNLF